MTDSNPRRSTRSRAAVLALALTLAAALPPLAGAKRPSRSDELAALLASGRARPVSLALADLDGDGIPDLVAGFEVDGEGVLAVSRGNADAIYPNSPEAQARRAAGKAVDAPFLPAARFVASPVAPELLEAGDFDADGRPDVVAAARGGEALYLLPGVGRLGLAGARRLALPGPLVSLASGEAGRADGLPDLFASVEGSEALVFAGPAGALDAPPRAATADELAAFSARERSAAREGVAASARGRFNSDAIDDVVFLRPGSTTPEYELTAPRATFTVTTVDDSGPGSLRRAIEEANAAPGADVIRFNIPGSGTRTIVPRSELPHLFDPVTIDGTTQPGFAGAPIVEIDGRMAGPAVGVDLYGGQVVVRGLVVNGFDGAGMYALNGGGNIIEGNYIGTDATGMVARPNRLDGVGIENIADNTVGGTAAAARNVISGNGGAGIAIHFAGATGNRILGNYIGVDRTGASAVPNGSDGIFVEGAPGNTIGGTAAGARNVVSGNLALGIGIFGASSGTLIQGNYVGVDAAGTAAIGNGNDGVSLEGGTGSTIGGTTPAARNVISANAALGVAVFPPAPDSLVQGNYIGTDATGTRGLGNDGDGIYVQEATGTVIGGAAPGAGNLISDNEALGIGLFRASGVVIRGNRLGTAADGTSPLGNAADGLYVEECDGTVVGGAGAGEGNTIAFNGYNGIFVHSGAGHTIRGNRIFGNADLGIDLRPGGVTANDPGDADTGTNGLQNFPTLFSASSTGGSVTVRGRLDSAPGTAYTLDFFANRVVDPFGNGEGETFVGAAAVTTDGSGTALFDVTFAASVAPGAFVSATATDPSGNTSEFSECVQVELSWEPPAEAGGAPRNLTITRSSSRLADPAPAARGGPATVVSYRVYRSPQPNTQPTAGNLYATVPPTQTTVLAPASVRGFYVVTAVYSDGTESPASNAVAADGAPTVRSFSVNPRGTKIVVDGEGFSDEVEVIVDSLRFSVPAQVKKRNTRVVQKGVLLPSGLTFKQYLESRPRDRDGKTRALIGIQNSTTGGLITIPYEE